MAIDTVNRKVISFHSGYAFTLEKLDAQENSKPKIIKINKKTDLTQAVKVINASDDSLVPDFGRLSIYAERLASTADIFTVGDFLQSSPMKLRAQLGSDSGGPARFFGILELIGHSSGKRFEWDREHKSNISPESLANVKTFESLLGKRLTVTELPNGSPAAFIVNQNPPSEKVGSNRAEFVGSIQKKLVDSLGVNDIGKLDINEVLNAYTLAMELLESKAEVPFTVLHDVRRIYNAGVYTVNDFLEKTPSNLLGSSSINPQSIILLMRAIAFCKYGTELSEACNKEKVDSLKEITISFEECLNRLLKPRNEKVSTFRTMPCLLFN